MDSRDDLLKRIANLEHKLDVLVENRVGILEDIEEIKRLQRMYGYYIDLCLWEPMANLFAEKGAAIEIGSRGRYVGKDNVLKFLRCAGPLARRGAGRWRPAASVHSRQRSRCGGQRCRTPGLPHRRRHDVCGRRLREHVCEGERGLEDCRAVLGADVLRFA
jgi:hypothetical protein